MNRGVHLAGTRGLGRRRRHWAAWLAIGSAAWLIGVGPGSYGPARLQAAEEYENFLNGLRARQYYDVALEYLNVMRGSPLLTDIQRQMVTFEEAQTYLEMSRSEKDPTNRDKALDGARDRFQQFVKDNPEHPQAPGAETQLGAVLVERGRNKVDQGLNPANSATKEKLLGEARKFFDESEQVFTQAEDKFAKLLATFPKFMIPTDPRVAERERVKNDLIKAHLFHAYGLYEKSRTFADGSPDFKKALLTAAEKYGAVYKDYRTLIAGLTARLKEGQCYQELKDTKRALGLFNDLLTQPDEIKALRPYKASAMYLSLQCWTADSEKMYELGGIQADEFIKGSSPDELQRPEWLAVRYFGAVAHKLRADQIPKDAKGEDAQVRDRSLDAAREYAEIVANTTCDYQDLARVLLKDISGGIDPTRGPRSFLEAQNRGTDSLTAFSEAMAALPTITDPAMQAAKQKEAEEARQKALDFFYQALSLADEDTKLEDKNIVRSYICYLLYTAGKTYDSALVGEYLLKFYPNSGGARQSAMIALASYVAEYQNNQDALLNGRTPINPEFDRAKMYGIASEIAKRWVGEKEANDAWSILLEIAINEQNIPEVLRALDNIPDGAPIRASAEMRAGRALWVKYGEQLVLDEGAPNKMPAKELQDLTVRANAVLEKALERQRAELDKPEKVRLDQAETEMFLCESRMALGQNAKALECVDDPKMGLLAVARAVGANAASTELGKAPPDADGKPAADRIKLESVKLALQAYVLNGKVAEAQKLTEELGTLLGGAGDQKAQLADTYLNLALKLEKQVSQHRATQNLAAIKETAKGFTFFLGELVKAGDAFPGEAKFQNLNWVSDNYFRLGLDLVGQPSPSTEDRALGVTFLDASSKLDTDVLTPLAEGDALLVVKLRKARALRRADKFDDALAALRDILKDKRFLIEGQMEACETLMDRGAKNKDAASYQTAINGESPDEKGDNIVWGWSRIAFTMTRSPQFANAQDPSHADFVRLYHTARLNVAQCFMAQALAADASDAKAKHFNAVIYTIDQTESAAPDLGGDEWKPKYQDLKDRATKALPSS